MFPKFRLYYSDTFFYANNVFQTTDGYRHLSKSYVDNSNFNFVEFNGDGLEYKSNQFGADKHKHGERLDSVVRTEQYNNHNSEHMAKLKQLQTALKARYHLLWGDANSGYTARYILNIISNESSGTINPRCGDVGINWIYVNNYAPYRSDVPATTQIEMTYSFIKQFIIT